MTVVDIDTSAEERIVAMSQGSATGLNLKENQKIYFGGLPTIGNYRYTLTHSHIFMQILVFYLFTLFCFLEVLYWCTVVAKILRKTRCSTVFMKREPLSKTIIR